MLRNRKQVKMSKQLWIRLVGLLSVFAWGVTATLFGARMIAPDVSTRAYMSILMFVSFAGAGPLTFLWTVLSIIESLDRPAHSHSAH